MPTWYNHQYAIVVGIDHYKRLSIPRLNNAVTDARSVASLLRQKGFSVIELYMKMPPKSESWMPLSRSKSVPTSGCLTSSILQDMAMVFSLGHQTNCWR